MLTFIQFLEELSQDHVALSPDEVQRMRDRFGDRVLQMGQLERDGSLSIPTYAIVEAFESLGSRKLSEAVENLKSDEMVAMLESAESLVDRVSEAQKRRLARMVAGFQSEPDETKAHKDWKQIEKMIFGVEYPD